jgi:hypothetical protein
MIELQIPLRYLFYSFRSKEILWGVFIAKRMGFFFPHKLWLSREAKLCQWSSWGSPPRGQRRGHLRQFLSQYHRSSRHKRAKVWISMIPRDNSAPSKHYFSWKERPERPWLWSHLLCFRQIFITITTKSSPKSRLSLPSCGRCQWRGSQDIARRQVDLVRARLTTIGWFLLDL